jgi:hypothetical protein
MRSRAHSGVTAAAATPGTAPPAGGSPPGRRLIAALLISAAALDLTRCSLALTTFPHVAPAVGLIGVGMGSAALSVTAARGYQAGHHWAAWAALLIGVASAPQASASGFHNPYTIPDMATAALGVLLSVAILATVGRPGTQRRVASHCWDAAEVGQRCYPLLPGQGLWRLIDVGRRINRPPSSRSR